MSAWNNAHTQTYGHDLAFFTEDGTRLACEKDTWVHNGESLVWVKLPTMTRGTKFYMCYNVADGVYVTNDNPWGGYVGVWHLKETGGAGKTINDASPNGMNGLTYAGSTVAAGAVGAGRVIANNNDHAYGIVVDATNGVKKTLAESLGTDFHASFWMSVASTESMWKWSNLIGRRKGDNGTSWGFAFHHDDKNADQKKFMRIFSGSTTIYTTTKPIAPQLRDGTWKKVDVVWRLDESQQYADVYTNGVFVESKTLGEPVAQENCNIGIGCSTQDNPLNMGGSNKGRRFAGSMDEVRLKSGVPSRDWVKADYDTVNNASFVIRAPSGQLLVSWVNAFGAEPGLDEAGHNFVIFEGTVQQLGDSGISSCAIQCKVWKTSASEPENWTTLTNGLVASDAFEVSVTGLDLSTEYSYKLRAIGNDQDEANATEPVSGTFTTAAGLTITWSADSGKTGFSEVAYDFAIVGGVVSALGGATKCNVLGKVWADGEAEPSWEIFAENQSLGNRFTKTISGLARGTAYNYKLCAVGDDESVTDIVTGTITTHGVHGDGDVGSPYTELYDDGTNVFWVVKDFERLVDIRKNDTNGFTYDDFYHYDGSDMAFVDELGHIIPHEIDTWNKNGMSLIWVRLPEMVNGTKFTMCYRSPLVDPLPVVGNTFERYVGVWHMNETKNGVVELKDSTVNDHAGETHAESLAGINAGQMIGGNCRRVAQVPGSSSTYGRIIVFNGRDDLIRTGVGNVFTYSGWYKLAEKPPKWGYLVSRKTMDQDVGWGIQCEETSTGRLRVWSGSSEKGKYQLFNTTDFGTSWHYWTFVYDGSVNPDGTTNRLFHAYMDGEELPSTVTNFVLKYPVVNDANATYENLVIGGQQIGTGAFNGFVDEVRYSKGMRSPDWIKAEYLSTRQKDNAFVTKGTEVYCGVESPVPVVVWERGVGLPDTIIDVSYAYVQFAGTVTYCGLDATECRIEYQLWVDGESEPETWTTLIDHVTAGRRFSIPVTGLKQDMPYNFRIRAVNVVNGHEQQNREHVGSFRTTGNVNMADVEGELIRLDDKFVHRYRAGTYTFTTPDYVTNVEIMVVGGGGAGGYGIGGGGGGGGLFYSQSYPVTTNTTYKIHVGTGGIAPSNTTTAAAHGNGEISYFALASDEANPLIRMHGGGGGGSYADNEAIAKGADGASGGGGTYALLGGSPAMLGLPEEFRPFGHVGGRGNDKLDGGNTIGKAAAGGGGGAGRAGTSASFDSWYGGGAGGVGLGNSMTGETLFYGAGGGGGYAYRDDSDKGDGSNFTKPGGGGSGIGGNAADIRNGTLATSGVPNTGAGGGGGSKRDFNEKTPNEFWQGGNGGDGVVLISYEVHGRDPIAEEPRIMMTLCDYTDEKGYADIGYRIYWAGIQMETDDLYVLYSTSSSNEVANGEGVWVKAVSDTVGIGDTTFTPPEVGYTYWVRLVARKEANSFMYSDEIASFFVPAIRNNGSNWHMPNAESNQLDNVDIMYALYDMDPEAHLYFYWSENEDDVNGDTAPSGTGVHFLDLGTGRQSNDGTINLPASVGFERNKVYYTRFATGNEAGTKYFLSPRTMELQTIDKPRVIFPEATWSNNVATVEFIETTSHLDPQTVDLVAYYGTTNEVFRDNGKVKDMANAISSTAHAVNLGKCFHYPDGMETVTQFPLWSPVNTNYYLRLTLETNGVIVAISQRYQSLDVITAVPTNTLLIYVNETPHVSCYGDDPATPSYNVSYGGYTEGPGWDHWTNAMQLVGAPYCPVTAYSPSGQYDITQGNLDLPHKEPYWHTEPVIDPETGAQVIDPETQQPVTQSVPYYYMLCYTSSRHIVTNAIFSLSIDDISLPYTGEPVDTSSLVCMTNCEPRNSLPVSYQYRVGTNEWTSTMPSGYTDVGNFIVQFKASAESHDDVFGTFMVFVTPAPLTATITTPDIPYTGDAQIPVVTTNVTGLMHGDINPLTCSFRDESGEWLDDLPSFTQPGTYKLFFRVEAQNHTTFVTNCTFTITGWDFMINMDGATGYATPISMGRPRWLIDSSGKTGEQLADNTTRYEALNAICPNGLRLWQNYVIERTDFGKKVVATIMQRGSTVNPNAFVVHFPNIEPLAEAVTGLRVHYRLDKKLKGESEFTQGELTSKYETNIPLAPGDPTGLYVFNLVFTPTNELYTGESVISSVTTIGVLRVESAMTNTMMAVPWLSMSLDSTNEIAVAASEVVNPNSVGASQILYWDPETDKYRKWNKDGDGWASIPTVNMSGVSEAAADTTRLPLGSAFWLGRNAPIALDGSTNYIYLIGRYAGEAGTVTIAGGDGETLTPTMVTNPTMEPVAINDLVWSGARDAGDQILIPTEGSNPTILTWDGTNWGASALEQYEKNGRMRTRVIRKTDYTIPPGRGFWYYRKASGELSITFPVNSND